MFKSLCLTLSVAVAAASLATWPADAEAKRLGGGKAAGMQRSTPANGAAHPGTPPSPATPQQAGTPAQQAAPTPAAATAAAAAPAKRSWLGPIAGLAAGLGIAALLSHFGLGEAFANGMMMVLLAVAAIALVVWLMRRFGGARQAQPALAGAGAGAGTGSTLAWPGRPAEPQAAAQPAAFSPQVASPLSSAPVSLPGGMQASDFERVAKMIFVRLQAANDAGDLEDLRRFTTPELFASLRMDLLERGQGQQQTDVVQIEARLVDFAQENGQQVASVRYTGLIREESGGAANPFDEVWHLIKPVDDSRDWAIAGITPNV
ncbi:Tim44 domain-containing protein [Ideonella livida]|uniref:Tim44 domain-containing protein n=1 Tax=Ideonella livida TaxID=2707176 RepID=A0A7C9TIT3_9BURK|nr:TIM44-like domain-containing protein [Ideonella livida]NDY90642.1 Tim44 domain-containing protein [Ideonella livida]